MQQEKHDKGDGYARTIASGPHGSASPVESITGACAGYAVVRLWVSCEAKGGESISVVGSDPALGEWDLSRAQPLSATGRYHPHWVSDLLLLRCQDLPREVQFKFAVIRPADEEGEVRYESFNRTLQIPADAAGMLLEPAKPFVFGLLDAHSDLKVSEKGAFAESMSPGHDEICRTPSMMAAAADSAQGDMYRVASLLHTVSKKPELIIPDTNGGASQLSSIDCSKVSDMLWDRQVSNFSQTSQINDDMPIFRQESVVAALANGTLLPEGSGFRRSAARFCIIRFWVNYKPPAENDRILVVGDCKALEQALVLQTSVRFPLNWISDDVLLEVPPKGTQSRCVKYKFALTAGPETQPRFDDCERSFVIQHQHAGQLLEPRFPEEFGVSKESALQPRLTASDCLLDTMQDEVRQCGRSPSAAELADLSGFARRRSVAGGASMLDLSAAAESSEAPQYC